MKLEPLMLLTVAIGPPIPVGDGGTGNRVIANVSGGHFEGPRLRGEVLQSGADWVTLGPDGFGRVDVRIALRTDDGANVYVQYGGLLEYNEAVQRVFSHGGETGFGDAYFMTQLRFETGHPDYRWLNHRLAVAEGRLHEGQVHYQVYELCQG
jgi:hypothetical protein